MKLVLSRQREWINAFLRFFFKHLYTSLAWSYDLVAFITSAGQWRTWQTAGLEYLPPGRVLEIGHGTGHMLCSLSTQGHGVVGIDPSKQMTHIASRRLEKNDTSVPLVQAMAQALPFKNDIFHSVLSTFPSEYIFNPSTIREVWRVLKPEGIFVIIPGVEKIHGLQGGRKNILALLDEFASILYRITGEAIDPEASLANEFLKRLNHPGFSWEIQHVRQPRAVVMRIIARKMGAF